MIYTHVLNRGGLGVRSPLDALSVEAGVSLPQGAEAPASTHARLTGLVSLSGGRLVDGKLLKARWRSDLRR